jgi:hypothetical protein
MHRYIYVTYIHHCVPYFTKLIAIDSCGAIARDRARAAAISGRARDRMIYGALVL